MNRYGKGRVRVMRIHRDGDRHEVSELNVKAMIEGDFARAYTHADNSTSVSTDTIKNVVNIVALENTGLCTEEFCQVLAKKYLETYPQIASVAITAHETKWSRLSVGGKPHPHSFVLDSNGKPFVEVTMMRGGSSTRCWKCSAPPIARACKTACTGWAKPRLRRCRRFPRSAWPVRTCISS